MPAIFVGRFQPFHNGHLEAIKWILKKEKKIFIIIGSSQEFSTRDNPFSFEERKEMIKRTLLAKNIKNFKICGLPDFPDDISWAKNVLKITKIKPKDAIVFTQNPWTKECFAKIGVKVKPHPIFFNELSATQVREKIRKNKKWENLVPRGVSKYLAEIRGLDKIKTFK